MNKESIGLHAGVVWRLLNGVSPGRSWSVDQICEQSDLTLQEVYAAIGWLARENKIEFVPDGSENKGNVYLSLSFF